MSEFRLGDADVLSGTIELLRQGRWHASLTLDTDQVPSGAVSLTIAVGTDTVTLSGYARRAGEFAARTKVLVVGGAGGLGKRVEARFYNDTTARHVVEDILRDAGETLSDDSSSDTLDVQLALWTRRYGPACESLDAIARAAGAGWRVLPDGKVWFGVDSWPDAGPEDYDLLGSPGDEGCVDIGAPAYPATLLPGTTFRGLHVGKVTHMIGPTRLRTNVRFEVAGALRNDELAYLRGAIDQAVAPLRWFGLFAAKVTNVADEGLDVQLDDATMPALSKVPLRAFTPGAKSTVKVDTRVLVAWEDGDPRRPIVLPVFEYDASKQDVLVLEQADGAKVSLKSGGALDLTAGGSADTTLNGGSAKVARVGDEIEAVVEAGTFVKSVVGQAAGVLNPAKVNLKGTIKKGADTVKA